MKLPSTLPFYAPRNFYERAAELMKLGIPIIPLAEQDKGPVTANAAKDASTSVEQIEAWAKDFPNANVGAVAQDKFWFLDDDAGTLHTLIALPDTLKVKTSRGFHYYFQHDDASRAFRYGNSQNAKFDIPGFKGEARCNNQYVVAFGSVHPEGAYYEIVNEGTPIAVAPPHLLVWLQKAFTETEEHKGRSVKSEKKPLDPSKPHLLVKGPPPDDGFKALVEKVGMAPLIRRMNAMEDSRFHNPALKTGADDYCPIPSHGPVRKEDRWQTCFGLVRGSDDVLKCLGCGWSGDVIKAVRDIDGLPTMYDAARAICVSEGLDFADYFTESQTVEPTVEPVESADEVAGNEVQATFSVEEKPTKKAKKTGPVRKIVDRLASDVVQKAIRWFWPNRFAEKLNLIVGDPDNAKSLIAAYLATRGTRGQHFYDAKNTLGPIDVLMLCGSEDDWDDTIAPRLSAAGADLTRVHYIEMLNVDSEGNEDEPGEFRLDIDLKRLDDFLAAHPEIRLVTIDPVSSYLGENTKMNGELEIRAILIPLKKLANKYHVSVVGIMHLNKKVDLESIHRVGGAMAFMGVPRMVWLCAPMPADEDEEPTKERVMVKVKGNIVAMESTGLRYIIKTTPVDVEGETTYVPYVEFVGDTQKTVRDLGSKAEVRRDGKPTESLSMATAWLQDYLLGGPQTVQASEAAGKAFGGFSPSTLSRARNETKDGHPIFLEFDDGKRGYNNRKLLSVRLADFGVDSETVSSAPSTKS